MIPARPDPAFWAGRRVLVTGHTGFKGAWLTFWLTRLGADVTGFSDGVPTRPSLFEELDLAPLIQDRRGDVRDAAAMARAVAETAPSVILHLAAQSLVRRSYAAPDATFATNVMGTVNVLEAARPAGGCTILIVTSDKCYENREWVWGYRETEPLGGHDPYSASKACAEIVAAAYARSFGPVSGLRVVSARAGNVIGGGDWAEDRLVPDLVRALCGGRSAAIRNPDAVRPWQHVLEPLCGYLVLAERAARDDAILGEAWNFGPDPSSDGPVRRVADAVGRLWPREVAWHDATEAGARHEARTLRLDSSKARAGLRWRPRWDLDRALAATVEVYRSGLGGEGLRALLGRQIDDYVATGESA